MDNIFNREIADKYNIVPVRYENNILDVLSLKDDEELKKYLEYLTGKNINLIQTTMKDIEINKNKIFKNRYLYYLENDVFKLNEEEKIDEITDTSVVIDIVNNIISYAISLNSSDIHFEGKEDYFNVRFRIDGSLTDIIKINKKYQQNIISRIKVLCNLDYTIRSIPQDSRFTFNYNNRNIDIRVATIPTVFGEKLVLRILDRQYFQHTKEGIGLSGKNLQKVDLLLQQPSGLILCCGPTGSGKSSTIYTLLKNIAKEDVNIITIEDPVEFKISEINQVNINDKSGLTFEKGLEAILRLDPDAVMVGEIRNLDTARTAIGASITGRKVFSTIHTSDCPSTIYRLKDMGVEDYLISSGLIGIISQRLVRKLCDCKKKVKKYVELFNEEIEYYEPVGCEKCNNGYSGRFAVYEILIVTERIRFAINNNYSLNEIERIALEEGMVSMKEALKSYLVKGTTSIEEIYKNIFTI